MDGQTNRRTDGRTDAYVAFRVYYFVGGWSREVQSAVLVADSISRVHALLNAVILRKEVVDFSPSLSPLHSLLFLQSLSLSLSIAVYSRLSYPFLFPSSSLVLRLWAAFFPSWKEERKKKEKENRILLCYSLQCNTRTGHGQDIRVPCMSPCADI